MKKLIMFAALIAIATVTTFAQKGQNGKLTPNTKKDRVAHISRVMSDAGFSLSDNQATQLRDVYATEQVKMQGLRNTQGMEKDMMREKMKSIRMDTQKKVNSILSDEQILVLDEMRKARGNRGHRPNKGEIDGTGGHKPMKDGPQTGGVKPPRAGKKKGKRAKAYMKLSNTLDAAGVPLTKEQGIKIKDLFANQRAALKDLRGTVKDDAAFKAEAKKMRKATTKQVQAILTKTQRKAVKKAKKEARS